MNHLILITDIIKSARSLSPTITDRKRRARLTIWAKLCLTSALCICSFSSIAHSEANHGQSHSAEPKALLLHHIKSLHQRGSILEKQYQEARQQAKETNLTGVRTKQNLTEAEQRYQVDPSNDHWRQLTHARARWHMAQQAIEEDNARLNNLDHAFHTLQLQLATALGHQSRGNYLTPALTPRTFGVKPVLSTSSIDDRQETVSDTKHSEFQALLEMARKRLEHQKELQRLKTQGQRFADRLTGQTPLSH